MENTKSLGQPFHKPYSVKEHGKTGSLLLTLASCELSALTENSYLPLKDTRSGFRLKTVTNNTFMK